MRTSTCTCSNSASVSFSSSRADHIWTVWVKLKLIERASSSSDSIAEPSFVVKITFLLLPRSAQRTTSNQGKSQMSTVIQATGTGKVPCLPLHCKRDGHVSQWPLLFLRSSVFSLLSSLFSLLHPTRALKLPGNSSKSSLSFHGHNHPPLLRQLQATLTNKALSIPARLDHIDVSTIQSPRPPQGTARDDYRECLRS